MVMNRRFFFSVLAISSLESCSAAMSAGNRPDFVAYKEVSRASFEVFDFTDNSLTVGGPEILGSGRNLSEFRGPLDPCRDAAFYCYVTGLHVAVPRAGTASSWNADGIQCHIIGGGPLSADQTVRISCRASPRSAVEFSFSRQQGIISYKRLCAQCFEEEYVLIGPRGIFASPSTP